MFERVSNILVERVSNYLVERASNIQVVRASDILVKRVNNILVVRVSKLSVVKDTVKNLLLAMSLMSRPSLNRHGMAASTVFKQYVHHSMFVECEINKLHSDDMLT